MKCIIIDDEPLAREGILLNASEVHFLEVIGEFNNALEANNFLSANEVDLMFLDIEMPGVNGLEFLRSIKKRPLVILTTAYPQYALESYELDAVDYLVKPIRLDRFIKAVNKAKELHDLLQLAGQSSSVEIAHDYIYIKSDRKYIKVFFKDIAFIKGMKDYVVLYSGKEKIITAMNIKTIHEQLPSSIFARVSKSHIVNIQYIQSIDQDSIQLRADIPEEIPLGDTYREDFINRYVRTNLVQRK
ncbi:MAG: response regulator transcription factor [Saprospiraceae bacterium]|nr:response regulator transcription factor [Saprospiraceae bacterium]